MHSVRVYINHTVTYKDSMKNIKPSQLIRDSIEAVHWFSNQEDCGINMDRWHYTDGKTCTACQGGAYVMWKYPEVFKNRMEVDGRSEASNFAGVDIIDAEDALDHARVGEVGYMFASLCLNPSDGEPFDREITDYREDPEGWERDQNKLADDLAKKGL